MKSKGAAFVLTFFFGPLGMFYSTVPGALIMLVISVVGAIVTFGVSILLTWPICIVWGITAVDKHNAALLASMAPPQPIHGAAPAIGNTPPAAPPQQQAQPQVAPPPPQQLPRPGQNDNF